MNRLSAVLTGFFAVGALTIALAVPANAEDNPSVDTGSILSQLTSDSTSPATDVLSDVAQVPTDSAGQTAPTATGALA